jgi:hypothetical protein
MRPSTPLILLVLITTAGGGMTLCDLALGGMGRRTDAFATRVERQWWDDAELTCARGAAPVVAQRFGFGPSAVVDMACEWPNGMRAPVYAVTEGGIASVGTAVPHDPRGMSTRWLAGVAGPTTVGFDSSGTRIGVTGFRTPQDQVCFALGERGGSAGMACTAWVWWKAWRYGGRLPSGLGV